MSRYAITADKSNTVYSPLTYSAVVCNRTHITKVILRGTFSFIMEDIAKPFPNFTIEINGRQYQTNIPIRQNNASFDTDILLEKGDTLSITVISTSGSSEYELRNVIVDIHNGHSPGWDCASGFFAIEYEGTREEMWQVDSNNYPTLNGVTAELEYYNNYNLPHPHKYKVTADINDGYPYIHRIKSGWCAAYPYKKDGAWSNSRVFVRTGGGWKECSTAVFDAMSALYHKPKINTAWKITLGKNGGYPYIAYGEMPFYENS